jgi:hypothetical protein
MTPPAATVWVDHHLLLNSMSVMRNRVATGKGDSLALIDAISGYLSSGLYIEKRSSMASVSWLLDWIECLAVVTDSVAPKGGACQVVIAAGGDDDRVAHLGLACGVVQMVLSFAPGEVQSSGRRLELRLSGDQLHLTAAGADSALLGRWQELARVSPPGAVRLEPSLRADAVACSVLLPAAG